MYCKKCGKEMEDGSRLCIYCGAEAEIEVNEKTTCEPEKISGDGENSKEGSTEIIAENGIGNNRKNSKKKQYGILAVAAAAVIALVLFIGISIYNRPENRLARALDLGQKYLLEENYEQAIVEFDKAIEIDPKNADAYAGLADAYFRSGEYADSLAYIDQLLEMDSENTKIKPILTDCLGEYIKILAEEERYDEMQALAEKYGSITEGVDFLLAYKRHDNIEELVKKYWDEVDSEDTQILIDGVEEQVATEENGVWVDELYQKMISGDIEAVYAVILEPDFIEKCSEYAYEYQKIDEFSGAYYGLLTSEGKEIIINEYIHPAGADFARRVYAFYCVHEDDSRVGFVPETVSGGDYYYGYTSPEEYNGRDWLIDDVYHSMHIGDGVLPYGEVYHMLFSAIGG